MPPSARPQLRTACTEEETDRLHAPEYSIVQTELGIEKVAATRFYTQRSVSRDEISVTWKMEENYEQVTRSLPDDIFSFRESYA